MWGVDRRFSFRTFSKNFQLHLKTHGLRTSRIRRFPRRDRSVLPIEQTTKGSVEFHIYSRKEVASMKHNRVIFAIAAGLVLVLVSGQVCKTVQAQGKTPKNFEPPAKTKTSP